MPGPLDVHEGAAVADPGCAMFCVASGHTPAEPLFEEASTLCAPAPEQQRPRPLFLMLARELASTAAGQGIQLLSIPRTWRRSAPATARAPQ